MEVIFFLGMASIEALLLLLAEIKIRKICKCAIIMCSIIAVFYFCYHLHQIGLCLNGANWFWILAQKSWTKEKLTKVVNGFILLFSIMLVVTMTCCVFDEN